MQRKNTKQEKSKHGPLINRRLIRCHGGMSIFYNDLMTSDEVLEVVKTNRNNKSSGSNTVFNEFNIREYPLKVNGICIYNKLT